MTVERECYQCGRPTSLLMTEDPADEWLHCEHCGERLVNMRDFRKKFDEDEEERVKRALGFHEFKPKR